MISRIQFKVMEILARSIDMNSHLHTLKDATEQAIKDPSEPNLQKLHIAHALVHLKQLTEQEPDMDFASFFEQINDMDSAVQTVREYQKGESHE